MGASGLASGIVAGGAVYCQERSAESSPRKFGVHALPPDLGPGLCNSGDSLAQSLPSGAKVVWFMRHGQSTSNVGLEAAIAADGGTPDCPDLKGQHLEAFKRNAAYADAPLTAKGKLQALEAASSIATWRVKPELVVCSPLTRSIQTAAIMFAEELASGHARLVVRPELREFFSEFLDARGRQIAELGQCQELRELAQWLLVAQALSDEATGVWREMWDHRWACGEGVWREHCNDGERANAFSHWLQGREETYIAVVCHWGTINNVLNRQPWTLGMERKELPWPSEEGTWPRGGLVRMFDVPNCGWVAMQLTETPLA